METHLVFVQDRRLEGIWPLVLAPLIAVLILLGGRSYIPLDPIMAPVALVVIAIPGLYRIFWGRAVVVVDKAEGAILLRRGPGGKEERLASLDQVRQADVAVLPRGNAVVYRPYLSLKNNTKVDLLPESGDADQARALASAVNDAIKLPAEARDKLAMSKPQAGRPYTSRQALVLWVIVLALVLIAIAVLAVTSGG